MKSKSFPCKLEEVPVIGEFIVSSAERDIDDFSGYSAMFNLGYLGTVRSKIDVCKELVKASAVSKELKFVTDLIYDKCGNFRIPVNVLEGYLKLGADKLDISVKDVGLKNVRMDISKRNIEGLLSNMQTSLVAVKRNFVVLEAYGMKQTLLDAIEAQLKEIGELNVKQNTLMSKRNSLTVENIDKFNDLWSNLKLIINTAKAIYRGVNEAKLKDYTITHLKKRVNAER
jgi:hypothetical protein